MQADVHVAQTPKGSVEYTVKGSGEPILLIHGSLQNCSSSMGTDAFLKAGFSIITPSRPGYGNTPAESGRTAQEAAGLLNALLDCLNVPAAHVLAVSYGGLTALSFAANYPQRVKKLVLASAISMPLTDVKRLEDAKRFYGKGHKAMWSMLGLMGAISKRSLVKKTYELFSTCDTSEIMKEITKEDIDAIVAFYRKKPENIGALVDLEHSIPDGLLAAIQAPTLVVHSKEDRAVPFEHAEYAHGGIKGSELYVANTWGHFSFIGKGSGDVLKKVEGFLAG